jgi:hypothetical protein
VYNMNVLGITTGGFRLRCAVPLGWCVWSGLLNGVLSFERSRPISTEPGRGLRYARRVCPNYSILVPTPYCAVSPHRLSSPPSIAVFLCTVVGSQIVGLRPDSPGPCVERCLSYFGHSRRTCSLVRGSAQWHAVFC